MVKNDEVKKSDYFKLNVNDNDNFVARSNDAFLSLGKVEREYENNRTQDSKSDIETKNKFLKRDPNVADEDISGLHSKSRNTFKRPRGVRRVSAYRHDPTKWKKYSLADVSDISDTSNRNAAFSFLNELKKKNSEIQYQANETITADTTDKILFKKPLEIVDNDGGAHSSEMDRSSKFVMPEYVVGQKITKCNKSKSLLIKNASLASKVAHEKNTIDLNIMDDNEEQVNELQNHNESNLVSFRRPATKRNRCLRKRDEDDD